MKLHKVSIIGYAAIASALVPATNIQVSSESSEINEAVDEAVNEVLQIIEAERIRDARTDVCRLAASKSGNFWDVYEKAVIQEPSIGPVIEIANRCHFFISGRLYQLNKQREDVIQRGG